MTRDEIIKMAREAGMTVCRDEWVFGEMLERFAALVAAAAKAEENEACASICFQEGPSIDGELIAEAIRARSNT